MASIKKIDLNRVKRGKDQRNTVAKREYRDVFNNIFETCEKKGNPKDKQQMLIA